MKRTRLRRMSAKRRAANKTRVRVGVEIPATCELTPLLEGVEAWHKFSADWPEEYWRTIDPHHVWTPPRWDHPSNVVTVCRVAHDWIHDCFQRAGRMVATEALCRAGRFDRDLVRERWGRDPIAAIHVDYDNGVFSCDPTLDALCIVLLERF